MAAETKGNKEIKEYGERYMDSWREKFISTYELAFYKKACLLSSGKDDSTKMTATLLQILFLIWNSEIKLPQQSSNTSNQQLHRQLCCRILRLSR